MKVKVAKWGNSLGVRLPKAAVENAGVTRRQRVRAADQTANYG